MLPPTCVRGLRLYGLISPVTTDGYNSLILFVDYNILLGSTIDCKTWRTYIILERVVILVSCNFQSKHVIVSNRRGKCRCSRFFSEELAVIFSIGIGVILLVFMFGIRPAELISDMLDRLEERKEERQEE